MGVIPANTQLQTSLSVSNGDEKMKPHVRLSIQVMLSTVATFLMTHIWISMFSVPSFTLFSTLLSASESDKCC